MANTIKTTRHLPIYTDEEGYIYRQLTHAEGMRDEDAVREILPPPKPGDPKEVRWLSLMGTAIGSAAEQKELAKLQEQQAKNAKGNAQQGSTTQGEAGQQENGSSTKKEKVAGAK